MQALKEFIKEDQDALKQAFYKTYNENKDFQKLCDALPVKEDIKAKYTSLLQDSAKELQHCKNCKRLDMCQNTLKGYCYTPVAKEDHITFEYKACAYQNKVLEEEQDEKNMIYYHTPKSLLKARMKNLYLDDESRVPVIKYLDDFHKHKKEKGLYLYGSFGSGKTYMISALFHELAKENKKCAILYVPEFIRSLKSSFNNPEEKDRFQDQFGMIKNVDILLLDDIGAENVSAWSRDEIIGPLLQHRMEEELPTFFTSNLSYDELEERYATTSGKVEKINAKRIMERVKYLSVPMSLMGTNHRQEK